jgi:hypothetical protein
MANVPKTTPVGPDVKFALLLMCVECGQGVEALFPIERDAVALLLAQHGWFVSVMTPPGQGPEVPIVFGVLCDQCAPKVFPPEVMKAAEERRQQLLATAVPR